MIKKKSTAFLLAALMVSGIAPSADAAVTSNKTLAGTNRYKTAVSVSNSAWSNNGSKEAILVSGYAMSDALSATPLAYAKNAPILLTDKDNLNADTKAELKRLGVTKVYIVGGSGVVTDKVKTQLESEKITVERIAGNNREQTSLKVAQAIDALPNKDVSQIAVVNGYNGLPDAISIGAYAAKNNMPVLLTSGKDIPTDMNTWIQKESINKSYVIGGAGVVSDTAKNKLPNNERIQGDRRGDTNAAVIDKFYTSEDLKTVYVANDSSKFADGSKLADALAVGPVAAKNNAPVVIVRDSLTDKQRELFFKKKFSTLIQVGGDVSSASLTELKNTQNSTVEVKTIAELKNALGRATTGEVINFRPTSTVNEELTLSSSKDVTVNLYGTYSKTVNISMSNGAVNNHGNINATLNLSGIKAKGFTNKGSISSLKVTANGVTITNNGTITNFEGKSDTKIEGNQPTGTISQIAITKVESLNNTQAIVTFATDVTKATFSNFSMNNNITVTKAEIMSNNKKQVKLTFDKALTSQTTYKLTVNGIEAVGGQKLTTPISANFIHEVYPVNSIALTKTEFYDTENIKDFLEIKDTKGRDITKQVLAIGSGYTIEINSTNTSSVNTSTGAITWIARNENASVDIKVKEGSTTLASTGTKAIKVSPLNIVRLDGFHIGSKQLTVDEYKQKKLDNEVSTLIKEDSGQQNLSIFVVNELGDIVKLDANKVTDITASNNPSATLNKSNSNFTINPTKTGTTTFTLKSGAKTISFSVTVSQSSYVNSVVLDKTDITLNTAAGADDSTTSMKVKVDLKDQHSKLDAFTFDTGINSGEIIVKKGGTEIGKLSTSVTSNPTLATATIALESNKPVVTIAKTNNAQNGNLISNVEVKFTAKTGTTSDNRTGNVTVRFKDYGVPSGYKIVTDRTASIDANKDISNDKVGFKVYDVDSSGNILTPNKELSSVTLEIENLSSLSNMVKNNIVIDGAKKEIKFGEHARHKFSESGNLNVIVKVNGVEIGKQNVTYTNTDQVATSIDVDTSDILLNLSDMNLGNDNLTVEELLFGRYTSNKYLLNPILKVKDQSNKEIKFDTSATGDIEGGNPSAVISTVKNKLKNEDKLNNINYTITNPTGLTVQNGQIQLASSSTVGTFRLNILESKTQYGVDLLSAPVYVNVTVVR